MIRTQLEHNNRAESVPGAAQMSRHAAIGQEAEILTDIYQQDTNIAIWQRELSAPIEHAVRQLLITKPEFATELILTPQDARARVAESIDTPHSAELCADVAELVDMFCCLFALKRVGMRLHVLAGAMCPKFHDDRVPCRLVTTYQGVATEWLPHERVERTKLGRGSLGQTDSQSGLYQSPADIQQLRHGDVALLKGLLWQGNENAGLVHRSPTTPGTDKRLLFTLDFIN
ncbi:MAG: succinylglutamate desuccinylase [Gammaproteobacteria bacterium TMED119]|nr:MAG: succinylglutamate desuccinylase [Gammaproteobacteria bacterium TMED119]RCL46833.1 MAG: DUF1826 domain-containing protein [Candidatus Thioglobus sp.]|tara:strand:+ start:7670 stop:8359 length:690 start_codon:yes stop_codon:yes gene_type:complete